MVLTAVGADFNLVSTYIGQMAPPDQRGKISVLTFLIGIIGQAATPFVGWLAGAQHRGGGKRDCLMRG